MAHNLLCSMHTGKMEKLIFDSMCDAQVANAPRHNEQIFNCNQ